MKKTLVSIIICTYNSGKFVYETLDSLKAQNWSDLELIITDDCSEDETVELCRRWLDKNNKRFVRTELLMNNRNLGTSSNANRGIHASKGVWIKFLGADDTMLPNCISDNMAHIARNPEIRVLSSKVNIYRNTFEKINFIGTTPGDVGPGSIIWQDRTAESQYKMLLTSDRIHFTPSFFLHRETLNKVGGFDERFRLIEDYPLWLNLTRNGYKLFFMDKVTVNYRQHSKAINNTGVDYLINPNYFRQESFRRIYTYPYLPTDIRLLQCYNWYVLQVFQWNWLNRNKKFNKFLQTLLIIYLNPFKYFIWFKKRFKRNLGNNEFYQY